MKGYEHLSETIEAYVANQLSAQERTAFEAMLLKDVGLQSAVENEKILSNLVLEQDLNKIKNKIKTDLDTAENKNTPYKSVALTALLISSLALTYFYFAQKKSDNILEERNKIGETQNVSSILQNKADSTIKTKITKSESEEVLQNQTSIDTIKQARPSSIVKIKDSIQTPKHEIIKQANQIQEIVKKENPTEKTCLFEKVDAHFVSNPSQKGVSTGTITIKLPYSIAEKLVFSINKNGEFVKNGHFSELAKGVYHLTAKDTKECEYDLGQTIVKETNCIADYQKTFSPDIDSPWQIPVLSDENATINIKNKVGDNMYSFQGKIGNEMYWNGQSLGGGAAPIGVYKIFVTYSNGEDCVYSVTLFR